MKGENAMDEGIEILGIGELIDPKLEEFVRESERNRIISIFATKKKSIFTAVEVISLICGYEVTEDERLSL